MPNFPTILVDTREQRPLIFDGYKTRRQKLDVGDYSLSGYATRITAEYKSLTDWLKFVTQKDKRRFNSQVRRLIKHPYSCIVVCSNISKISKWSQVQPLQTCDRVSYLAAAGIPVIMAENRKQAIWAVRNFLKHSKDMADKEE